MTPRTKIALLEFAVGRHRDAQSARIIPPPAVHPSDSMQRILPESLFLGMLCLERKRAERSRKRFVLLLVDAEDAIRTKGNEEILDAVIKAADAARRETDPAGWYKHRSVLGIIFTELGDLNDVGTVMKPLEKLHKSLEQQLGSEDHERVRVSVHLFVDDEESQDPDVFIDPTFYPDILHLHESKKFAQLIKRAIDISFSAAALLVLSPLMLAIAAMIKCTSKGPVLFKQERLGRFGNPFLCMKFRSMYANNDLKIHQDFVKDLIRGSYKQNSGGVPVFKMTNDPRITRVGRFLRRSSLDELPQFINVLRGDMSLVGPRPPLAYEFREYDIWHRRRVLEVKPGITGLWQVNGRSRVQFDDMVRLDLQYARQWCLWLDLQIIAQTPRAVIFGDGAY